MAPNQWLDLDSDWTEALNVSAAPQKEEEPLARNGKIRGYFDGASRGNPGEAAAGAVLLDEEGNVLWKCARPLGKKTNNEAEYMALIFLLEEADRRRVSADVRGDSQLVVNQVTGKWKIKEPRLQKLASCAVELLQKTESSLSWVRREENAVADRLSNVALDGPGVVPPETKAPHRPVFDPEKLELVTDSIFLAHGTDTYAVDILHKACTCPAFQRTRRCKHLDAALEKFEK